MYFQILIDQIVCALLLMLFVYLLSLKLNFYSLVDIAWAYGFLIVTSITASHLNNTKTWCLAILFILWSLRLGTYLLTRILKHFPEEDGRYIELKRSWAPHLKFKFFIFFLMQGLSIVLLLTPFSIVALDDAPILKPLHFAAIALWIFAWCGESLADSQLKKFKSLPQNKKKVCDVGLWHYSRHPNYFFEWLIWCSFALFALASPFGWMGVVSPIIIFYLLFRVTGIPATEAQALKSKGEVYAEYQKSTSVFVPWPKKKGKQDAK